MGREQLAMELRDNNLFPLVSYVVHLRRLSEEFPIESPSATGTGLCY